MNKMSVYKFLSFGSPSEKWVVKQITIDLPSDEAKALENYCNQTGKATKDVIRELIQGLNLT